MADATADHVRVVLTLESSGLARQGYGIPLIPSHNAPPSAARVTYHSSLASVGEDYDDDSPEYLCARAMFSQRLLTRLAIGRAAGSVTLRYDLSIAAVTVGREYAVDVTGEGVTATTVSYTPAADLTFTDTEVNVGSDTISILNHGETTGNGPYRLSNTGGALPSGTGIAVDTNVWVIAPTTGTLKFATSKANALALTAINITAAAGGGTHTLRRAQNDVICAQLVQGINAVTGANYTATQVTGAGETDTVRVTANAAGNWFALAVNDVASLGLAITHAAPSDVTLATDLAAMLTADTGWYTIVPLYPSADYLLDIAAWAESNGRMCAITSHDTDIITTTLSGGTDVASEMYGLGYTRTLGCYHHIPGQFMGAAEMGRWLPTLPGKATPKFKTLVGVTPTPLTDTHKVNLRAKRWNAYEQVRADRAFFWEGTVPSTVYRFFDVTRNADWLEDGANAVLLGVLVANDIVPHTPEGRALLENALRGFVRGEAVDAGVLAPTPTVTASNTVSDADKASRNYAGLAFDGQLAGAVHTLIPVSGTLTF